MRSVGEERRGAIERTPIPDIRRGYGAAAIAAATWTLFGDVLACTKEFTRISISRRTVNGPGPRGSRSVPPISIPPPRPLSCPLVVVRASSKQQVKFAVNARSSFLTKQGKFKGKVSGFSNMKNGWILEWENDASAKIKYLVFYQSLFSISKFTTKFHVSVPESFSERFTEKIISFIFFFIYLASLVEPTRNSYIWNCFRKIK